MKIMKNDLENSLIESIGNENIKNISFDYGELLLDTIVSDETIKSLPILNTLYSITKIGLNIRDHLLMKKILQFLFETESLNEKAKEDFIGRISNESKYRTRVGEQLMLFLDRIDDLEKPIILGKLFKSTVENSITYDTFLRLSSIVTRSFTPDLLLLKELKLGRDISKLSKETLASQGLLSINLSTEEKIGLTLKGIESQNISDLDYQLNDLSQKLLKYGIYE